SDRLRSDTAQHMHRPPSIRCRDQQLWCGKFVVRLLGNGCPGPSPSCRSRPSVLKIYRIRADLVRSPCAYLPIQPSMAATCDWFRRSHAEGLLDYPSRQPGNAVVNRLLQRNDPGYHCYSSEQSRWLSPAESESLRYSTKYA